MATPKLPLDVNRQPMQMAHWDTTNSIVLDGSGAAATSSAYTYDTAIRFQASLASDCWIKIGDAVVAVSGEGALLVIGGTDSTVVRAGEVISVIGGVLNITPYAE